MQPNYLLFIVCALWMQVLLLPKCTEGLTCFSCNSKTEHGCQNDDLKSGHLRNMFTEKCPGSDAVCVKQSAVVARYYEAHYARADMKEYYAALDDAASCRGIGVPEPFVTSAPSGNGTTIAPEDGPPGDTAAAGSAGGGGGGGGGSGAAGTSTSPAEVTEPSDDDGGIRRRRGVAANCPAYPEFPEPQSLAERGDERRVYSCGNRSHWFDAGYHECHKHSDGIVQMTTCLCAENLCNGVAVRAAVPFLVLAAELLHLRRVIG